MPMRYHAAGVTGRTDKKDGYRDAPASIKGGPESLNSYLSDFQAGQGLVWHGSKPVRHHRQNVSLHESHLQVDLLQLGHHVPRAKKTLDNKGWFPAEIVFDQTSTAFEVNIRLLNPPLVPSERYFNFTMKTQNKVVFQMVQHNNGVSTFNFYN